MQNNNNSNTIDNNSSGSASSLLSRGTIVNGAVSISLDDSWTGRSLLEALGRVGPLGGNFADVSSVYESPNSELTSNEIDSKQ